jgi:hypothetical protein
LPGVSHFSPEDSPDKLAELVENFLSEPLSE